MKIYFVRHGETEGNVSNHYQTESTPLTQKGRDQAMQIADRLKNLGIDLIYSSPHDRTLETSKILSEKLGIPIEKWGDLIEIRRPKEIRGKHPDDPGVAEIEEQMVKNFGIKDARISDEENFFDVSERARAVLTHLAKEHCHHDVVCVSHGTFIKVIASTILLQDALTPEIFTYIRHHLWAENTGLTVAEFSEKRDWRLLTWNDTSHL